MSREAVLRVRGLGKTYPGAAGAVVALEGVSFEVHPGEFVCLVGPSGCGKSSLLSMVAGLDAPSTGELLLDGRPIRGPGSDRGLVFQQDCLFPWLSVADNAAFALGLSRHRAQNDAAGRERVRTLLAQVGLERFAAAYPRELSGGMRQRAAIARALLCQPRILLMDEPFGALDAQTREQMQELVARLCRASASTVLLVTHDVEEAVFLGDRLLVMSAHPGRIAAEIAVDLTWPRDPELKLSPEFAGVRRRVVGALAAARQARAA